MIRGNLLSFTQRGGCYLLFGSLNCGPVDRNEQLKAEEASFRQAREQLLKKLEGKMKAAKAALSAAAAALKGEERASQVGYVAGDDV